MDFGIAIALGLLGSLHCAAMCGPLMLALPVQTGGPLAFGVGRLGYQLGRVMTYALLGIVAGLAGKSLFLIGAQRWISIGLGILILVGFLFSRKLALAGPIVHLVLRLKSAMSAQLKKRTLTSLLLLGMLNGLLPCGLVYVAMAGAFAQGSTLRAAIYMTLFGFGTLPTMLAISLSGRIFPPTFRLKLQKLVTFGACLVAVLLILRGMELGIPYLSPDFGAGCCRHH